MSRAAMQRKQMNREARKRATEESKAGGSGIFTTITIPSGVGFFKPVEGTNMIDILPYTVTDPMHPEVRSGKIQVGDLWHTRPFMSHRDIGPDGNQYVCPTSVGKPCPICDDAKRMKAQGADDATLDALRAKKRNFYNVKVRGENGEEKVELWDYSFFLWEKEVDINLDSLANDDFYMYADLDSGYTVKTFLKGVTKPIKGQNTKFLDVSRIDFVPRDRISDVVEAMIVDLDKAIRILPYEQLEAIYLGIPETQPAPVQPAPVQPAPVQPAPVQPAPSVPPENTGVTPFGPQDAAQAAPDPGRRRRAAADLGAVDPVSDRCPNFGKVTLPDGSLLKWGMADAHNLCIECSETMWTDCKKGAVGG